MTEITFRDPSAAWALAIGAVVVLLWTLVKRRRVLLISTGWLLADLPVQASPLRRLPALIGAAAFTASVLALMDPTQPRAQEQVAARGVDLAVVLDLSSSMEELMGTASGRPIRVTRMDVTRRAVADFIARRSPGDRIGLVVFSDNAYVIVPLTFDHGALQRYIAMIDTTLLRGEGRTAIGEGLSVAHALLARQAVSGRGRAIVLFTDGENTYGRDPVEALDGVHDAGIRVHMIGLDLAADVRQKATVQDFIRRVERAGGRYFTADTTGQLTLAARAIDELERGTLLSTRTARDVPAFEPFAAAALLLLGAAVALRCVPFFVDLS